MARDKRSVQDGSTSTNSLLRKLYFNVAHPAGFSSAAKLANASRLPIQKVKDWLAAQDTYTLHRKVVRKFVRNRYIVSGIRRSFEMDLASMQRQAKDNDDMQFILFVIDCYSREAWARPLKNKSGSEVSKALKSIFRGLKLSKSGQIRSDKGKEFLNANVAKTLKEIGLHHSVIENDDVKACMVERLILTIRMRLHKYFTLKGKERYVDVLGKVMQAYNTSKHSGIGMRPIDVKDNMMKAFQNMYSGQGRYAKLTAFPSRKHKFKVDDYVRMAETKERFAKGADFSWTYEVFKIVRVINRNPVVYKLEDLLGEGISGVVYAEEIQKVNIDPETAFKVDKVLGSRGKGVNKQYLVSFKGYPSKFNDYVSAKNLLKL
jgi:hypothetical protein